MTNISVVEYMGSGIKVREGVVIEKSTKVTVRNVSVTPFEIAGLSFAECSEVTLEYSIFSHSDSTAASDFLTQPVILSLKDTDIYLRHSTFVENNTTCIRAIHSKVKVQGNLTFINNRALSGAAFLLVRSSTLIISEFTTMTFTDNSALNYGGVFYTLMNNFLVEV